MGEVALAISYSDAGIAIVGCVAIWIRPARLDIAVGHRTSGVYSIAIHESRAEYELCVHRPILSSTMGYGSDARTRYFHVYAAGRLFSYTLDTGAMGKEAAVSVAFCSLRIPPRKPVRLIMRKSGGDAETREQTRMRFTIFQC